MGQYFYLAQEMNRQSPKCCTDIHLKFKSFFLEMNSDQSFWGVRKDTSVVHPPREVGQKAESI